MSPTSSLTELVVLGLVAEKQTHGWALARLLAPEGEVGTVWTVRRALVYRAVRQLTEQGLVREAGEAPGERGPNRTLVAVTPAGRRVLRDWLSEPVAHVRELRTEFLVKLVLLDRIGADRHELVARQRQVLAPIADRLRHQADGTAGIDAVLARWRVESSEAALRFLDGLLA